jgi:AcrR family transcriptional regulator
MTAAPAGRPRDPGVDRRVALAALDLFGEAGWAGFSMEAVARRAGVGKASLYLRWNSKEALLTEAVSARLAHVSDVDTGTLRSDLVELARQMLEIYAGDTGRAALRLTLEAGDIPGVAERYGQIRDSQVRAARGIVRRGIDRGELAATTSVTLLLDTLVGGAMNHALATPADRRRHLAEHPEQYACRLVEFLLGAVTAAAAGTGDLLTGTVQE